MVGRKLYRPWLLALWLWPSLGQAAALSLHFPETPPELGRTLRLEVSTARSRPSLASLDLSPWSPWLVEQRRGQVREEGPGQRMLVWLVPRRAGQVDLPALPFGGSALAGPRLNILPARDPQDGKPIRPAFSPPPASTWQRQQGIFRVSLVSPRPFLRWRAESAEPDGALLVPIPTEVTAIEVQGQRRYRYTTGWLIFPTRTGDLNLHLPAVEYGRDGVTNHRFYPSDLGLKVKPLPAYLPPSVAVGRVEVRGASRPWTLMRRGRLQTRDFEILSHGVPAKWWQPPPIRTRSGSRIQLFETPPVVHSEIGPGGLTVHYRYSLPLSVGDGLWTDLITAAPVFSFDPDSGRMRRQEVSIKLPLTLAPWQEGGLGLALLFWLWVLIRRALKRVAHGYRWLRGYGRALATLGRAEAASDLRMVLMQVAEAEGWPTRFSLAQWRGLWSGRQSPRTLAAWMGSLQAALYSSGSVELEPIRVGLREDLNRRLGVRRRMFLHLLSKTRSALID